MSIRIDRFAGTIPRMDPALLPEGAGQICHGFAPNSGVLRPLTVQGPYVSSHNPDGTLKPGIPADEVVVINKPAAPTLNTRRWLCVPAWGQGAANCWLHIYLCCWCRWIDAAGVLRNTQVHAIPMNYTWDYTETGLNVYCGGFTPGTWAMARGGPYYFRGPRFLFHFTSDYPYVHGGPAVNQGLPAIIFPTSPVIPVNHIDLYGPDGNSYARFQVIDYAGPIYDQDFMITDYAQFLYWFAPFACGFRINLNYAQPRRKHYYYAQSFVDATEGEREGPPSEMSAHLIARPGEVLKLNFPQTGIPGGGKALVYRSETGHDDFLKVKDLALGTVTFEDPPDAAMPEEIPPWGNYTDVTADLTAFLAGSVLHPAQFGVAFRGKRTWHSDRYRPHAWPEQNTVTYIEDIVAIAMAGDTTLVFTHDTATPVGGSVYGESGPDPANQANYCISRSHPLLNPQSLCQIGNTVFWVTYDGIAACRGSQVEIVTREYLSRNEWMALDPGGMNMVAADNCLYCEAATMVDTEPPTGGKGHFHAPLTAYRPIVGDTGNTLKIRFDLDEKLAALTSYSVTTGGAGTWLSKLYVSDRDTTFDVLRVCADGTVTVTATVDGVELAPVNLTSDAPTAVSWPHGRHWAFKLTTTGGITIRAFHPYDRVVAPGLDVVAFTPETTKTFEDMRVRWPQEERVAAAFVSFETAYDAGHGAVESPTIRFYAGRGQTPTPYHVQLLGAAGVYRQVVRIPLTDREADTDHRARVLSVGNSPLRIETVLLAREVEAWPDGMIEEGRTPIPAWLARQYRFRRATELRSVRVVASAAVRMRLFLDDDDEDSIEDWPEQIVEIAGPGEYRVCPMDGDYVRTFTSLRFDFVDAQDDPLNDAVSAVVVATSQPGEAPADGVHLSGAAALRRQVYRFQERALYSAVSVLAENYPLKLEIYPAGYIAGGNVDRDELAHHAIMISDAKPVALPWWRDTGHVSAGATVTMWEFDLRDNGAENVLLTRVDAYHLWPKRAVPVEGRTLAVQNLDGGAPWLTSRYEFAEQMRWYSFATQHDGTDPVWFRLYLDGAAIGEDPIQCVNGGEQYLAGFGTSVAGRLIEFRFFADAGEETPADHLVGRVTIYGANPSSVGAPLSVTGRPFLNREFEFGHAGRFSAAQVVMRQAYSGVTLRLRNELEGQVSTVVPGTDQAFALPLSQESARWIVSVEKTGGILYSPEVRSLVLYPEQTVKAGAGIEARARPGCPDWLQSRYEFGEQTVLAGLWVEADSYPVTLEATVDAVPVTKQVTVAGWCETGWTVAGTIWRFRFTDGAGAALDHVVSCVRLVPQIEVVVGPDGPVVLDEAQLHVPVRLRFPVTGAWAGASIDADAEAVVTITDGTRTATAVVAANTPGPVRLLASGETEAVAVTVPVYSPVWTVSVACTGRVRGLVLLPWRPVEVERSVSWSGGGGLPSWFWSRYVSKEAQVVRSGRIRGAGTATVYAGTTAQSVTYSDGVEYRFDTRREGKEFCVAFGTPAAILGFVLGFEEHVSIEAAGLLIRQAEGQLWRNKRIRLPQPGAIDVVCAVGASSVKLKPYGGTTWKTTAVEAPRYEAVVSSPVVASEFELDLVHVAPVTEVRLFTRAAVEIGDGPVVLTRGAGPWTWLGKWLTSKRPVRPVAVRAMGSKDVRIKAYSHDRASKFTKVIYHSDIGEVVALSDESPRPDWVLDIDANGDDDEEVQEVRVYFEQEAMVPGDGVVVLDGLENYGGTRLAFPVTGAWAGVRVDADASAVVTLSYDSTVITATVAAHDLALHRFSGGGHTIASPLYRPFWTLAVACAGPVRSVTLLAWVNDPCDGTIQWVEDGSLPLWFNHRYRMDQVHVPRSVLISGYSTVDLYADSTQKVTVSPTSGIEYRIDTRYPCKEMVLDFGTPAAVRTALVGCEETIAVGPQGYVLRQARGALWRNKRFEFTTDAAPSVVGCRRGVQVRWRPYNTGEFQTVAVAAPSYMAVVPGPVVASSYEIDFVAQEPVEEVYLFTRAAMPVGETPIVLRRTPEIYTFLDRRFVAPKPVRFTGVRVVATGAVTVSLRDHSRTLLGTLSVPMNPDLVVALPVLDLRAEWVVDAVADAAATEIEEVTLYPEVEVIVGLDGVVSLDGLPCLFGIRLRGTSPQAWAAAAVDAVASSVVTLTADDHVVTRTIGADDPSFGRLTPDGIVAPIYEDVWTLDVACAGPVRNVVLLAWRDEPSQGVIGFLGQAGIPQWIRTRYRFDKSRSARSYRVVGSAGTLYLDGSGFALAQGGAEQRIDGDTACLECVVDVTDPASLRSVLVGCEEHVEVGPHGIVLRRTDSALFRNRVLRLNQAGSFGVVTAKGASRVRVRAVGTSWPSWLELGWRTWTGILPAQTPGFEWELDLEYEQLHELFLFTRAPLPLREGVLAIRRDQDPWTWLDKRVETARPVAWTSMRVVATGTVVVTAMERDRTEIWTMTVHVADQGRGIRVPRADARRGWVFDAIPVVETTEIQEVVLATSMEALRRV